MKNKYLLFIFSVSLVVLQSHAQNVTQEEAKAVAQHYVNQNNRVKTLGVITVEEAIPQYYQGEVSYYVVPFKEGGYTVISAYDGYEPILMFTESGDFDEDDPSPSFVWWMSLYSQRI